MAAAMQDARSVLNLSDKVELMSDKDSFMSGRGSCNTEVVLKILDHGDEGRQVSIPCI